MTWCEVTPKHCRDFLTFLSSIYFLAKLATKGVIVVFCEIYSFIIARPYTEREVINIETGKGKLNEKTLIKRSLCAPFECYFYSILWNLLRNWGIKEILWLFCVFVWFSDEEPEIAWRAISDNWEIFVCNKLLIFLTFSHLTLTSAKSKSVSGVIKKSTKLQNKRPSHS